jgi:GNAT superfamily N-acetyltransferase
MAEHSIDTIESVDGQRMHAVVSIGGRQVGTLSIQCRQYAYSDGPPDRRYAEIRGLRVHELYRRSKIASDLIVAAEDWARRWGYTHIVVEASAVPDTPGTLTYEAAGFTARSIILDREVSPAP